MGEDCVDAADIQCTEPGVEMQLDALQGFSSNLFFKGH